MKQLTDKVRILVELNTALYENHVSENSNIRSQYGPAMNMSDRGELLDYLRESKKKMHKSSYLTKTPLLDNYMKEIRLQEYRGKTDKYDLSQSKRLPMANSKMQSNKSLGKNILGKAVFNLESLIQEQDLSIFDEEITDKQKS